MSFVRQLLSVSVCVSGAHSVQVLYDDTPVPKSPFKVSVAEGCDPSRVVATGPGLQEALTDKPNNFNIITRYCRKQQSTETRGDLNVYEGLHYSKVMSVLLVLILAFIHLVVISRLLMIIDQKLNSVNVL